VSRAERAAVLAGLVLLAFAVLAGWLPDDAVPRAPAFAGPSMHHLLGTDAFGTDVLAGVIRGARTALLFGVGVTLLALVFGCALGALAGMQGGVWDGLVERLIEVVGVFPGVILVALVRSLEARPTILSLVAVVALVRWAEMARLVRTLVLEALAEDWALAARASGAGAARIAFVHIGPNVLRPIAVSATLSIGAVVLTETALSFLGLGVPGTVASWGTMLGQVRGGAGPLVLLPPAVALCATVGSAHVLAQAAVRRCCRGCA
jgi:peptide/nickel transport system permease protein